MPQWWIENVEMMPVVLLLLLSLYVPFLGGGFLTDDFVHLDRLADVKDVATLATTPDAMGFYRPMTQASLKLDTIAFGRNAAAFRVVNLAIHAAVIGAALLVARLVLARPLAAALAVLAFVLTPKAHPIAVLWISARADLLMSLFSLIAVAAWILWSRNGRHLWLGVATAAYIAAFSSKETAFLLPVLFLVTPSATRQRRTRLLVVLMLFAVAAVFFAWRSSVGAMTPFSADQHYNLNTPVTRWMRSARNYAARLAPVPAALLVLVGGAGLLARGRHAVSLSTLREQVPVMVFSVVWLAVFLIPVLPLVFRSELYLYLPAFGAALLTASLAEPLIRGAERRGVTVIAIGLCVIGFGAYQVSRNIGHHDDLEFSAKFVRALEAQRGLADRPAAIAVVPSDASTERFLRDTIDWTLPAVLQHALGEVPLTGTIVDASAPADPNAIRLVCHYQEGNVTLEHVER